MINENILSELKQLKQSIEEVSVYDLNVYSSMELYSRVAGKINELIKEVMTYQGLLSEELLKELDYINNHMDNFLYEIRTNSEMAINDMNIAKDEMIEQVTNKINENQLLINSLLNYSSRLAYLERMMDLLFSENVSHRTKLLLEGNHLSLTNSKEGLIQVNSTGGNTLVNLGYKKESIEGNIGENGALILYFYANDNAVNTMYSMIKPSTTYTIVFFNKVNEVDRCYLMGESGIINNNMSIITTPKTLTNIYLHFYGTKSGATLAEFQNMDFIILEGDYTNKPIPDYFEGMQSSFEDKVVTQEMVDSGKELAENLGKYKVEYKVTGKNKFDKNKTLDGYEIGNVSDGTITKNDDWFVTDFIPVIPNITYMISGKDSGNGILCYNKSKQLITTSYAGTTKITIPNNVRYIKLNGLLTQKDTFQLEEGSTATAYEPYKEFTKTYYLNSPPLEGDTIEENNGNVYHVHRYDKVVLDGSQDVNNVFGGIKTTVKYIINVSINSLYEGSTTIPKIICDKYNVTSENIWANIDRPCISIGSTGNIIFRSNVSEVGSTKDSIKEYFTNNPVTVVYKLASPQYELISENDDLMMKCFNGSSIDYDSVIPVEITYVTFTGEGTSSTNLLVDDVNLETDEITREV